MLRMMLLVGISLALGCTAEPTARRQTSEFSNRDDATGLTATFMGVTTLVITDGETTLISDGYFSRVGFGDPLIEPNRPVITDALEQLGIDRAAAVMVVHSHFDHAMDAPVVAELTGAVLLGSESTANVGRGLGLPEQQIRVVQPGRSMRYGEFQITFYRAKHWPLPEPWASLIMNQSIDTPLVPPVKATDYKEGQTYSILIEHPQANMLLQGSAGYIPGALQGVDADVVFLGTGGLGDLPPDEQENYFREMVIVTGARMLYPIHWDKMSTPLNEPLQPAGDFDRAMNFLERKKQETGVDYELLPKGVSVSIQAD